jgi:hypothetical protein
MRFGMTSAFSALSAMLGLHGRAQGGKMTFTAKLTCLALMVPGFLMAGPLFVGPPAGCPATDVCSYALTMTGFNPITQSEDTTITWNIDFTFQGPEKFAAADGSLLSMSVTGTPASGWVEDATLSGLTSYGTDGAVVVVFDGPGLLPSSAATDFPTVTYTAFGTDAFWAQIGGPFNFGATSDPTATSGAFFVFTPASCSAPPTISGGVGSLACFDAIVPQATTNDCTACNVTIEGSPVPEPSSAAPFAMLIGISCLLFRRKRHKLPA